MDFLASITHSLTSTITLDESSVICFTDNSDESDREDSHRRELANQNLCVVCLNIRQVIWLFLLCKHANCSTQCSNTITKFAQTCPTFKTPISDKFQMYLN